MFSSKLNSPIGIFDSGLGGFSILKSIRLILPFESIFYIADRYYIPYGDKSSDFISKRSLMIYKWLIQNGIKALVIACNSATVESISIARKYFSIPIIGTEPAIKLAKLKSKSHIVGILATPVTLKSTRFQKLLNLNNDKCKFICQPCNGIVELIEKGEIHSLSLRMLIKDYLQKIINSGADVLLLGCTHYQLIKEIIKDIIGEKIFIVDNSYLIAIALQRKLYKKNLLNKNINTSSKITRFYTTESSNSNFQEMIFLLLNINTKVEYINIT